MKNFHLNNSTKKYVAILFLTFAMLLFSACGSGDGEIFQEEPALSDIIVGEWYGQVDVAQMVYQELGQELGVELSPEPVYCDVKMIFNEDQSCAFEIDVDSFSAAVGKCAEPYTSAIFGFDTELLVDMIMQYVAADIPADSGREEGQYEVDDENLTVFITTGDGETEPVYLDEDGCLQYQDSEIGQIIVFEKQ